MLPKLLIFILHISHVFFEILHLELEWKVFIVNEILRLFNGLDCFLTHNVCLIQLLRCRPNNGFHYIIGNVIVALAHVKSALLSLFFWVDGEIIQISPLWLMIILVYFFSNLISQWFDSIIIYKVNTILETVSLIHIRVHYHLRLALFNLTGVLHLVSLWIDCWILWELLV